MKKIYRTYADTEVWALAVNIECPHCGAHWVETDKDECGKRTRWNAKMVVVNSLKCTLMQVKSFNE